MGGVALALMFFLLIPRAKGERMKDRGILKTKSLLCI